MKCPKCGYTSFESNDNCKKCSQDLTAHRQTYGLKPVVLQADRREAMAAGMVAAAPNPVATAAPEQPEQPAADMFSFDIPDQAPSPPQAAPAAPFSFEERQPGEPASPFTFSFDEEPAAATSTITPEDAFADLLEPTHQTKPAPQATPAPPPPLSGDAPGEYDLSSFSWDDAPAETPDGRPVKKGEDDFSSLFGESSDAPPKK